MRGAGPGGRLWDGVVDWLAGADVGEPAAVDMAELLDSVSGPPIVALRGAFGIGVAPVAAALRAHPVGRAWSVVADEGPAPRVDADAVVTVTNDPGAVARPGEVIAHPRGRAGSGISLDDAHGPASGVVDPLAAAVSALVAAGVLEDVRRRRLERGVAAIAVARPVVRDELEDLLWP